jgi:hypothetical protein
VTSRNAAFVLTASQPFTTSLIVVRNRDAFRNTNLDLGKVESNGPRP